MYKYMIKISFLKFEICSDIDIEKYIYDEEPFGICINYCMEKFSGEADYKIKIRHVDSEELQVRYSDKELVITGDILRMTKSDYNKQFSLFGNKGIINKFVLHILESEQDCITLHASAIMSNDKILIGIGASGSGKSTLVSVGLKCGWKLIATEHVIIDNNLNIYKGNYYDNVSPYTLDFIAENIKEAKVYRDKRLKEPFGEKVFASYEKYAITEEKIKMNSNTKILILNFKKDEIEQIELKDKDFLLRVIQNAASEKITFPLIYCDKFVYGELNGNVSTRNNIIDMIMNSRIEKRILSGNYKNFEEFVMNC